jgi:hypothetical protein
MKRQALTKLGFRLRAELARPNGHSGRYDVTVRFADDAVGTDGAGSDRYVILSLTEAQACELAASSAVAEVELVSHAHPLVGAARRTSR